MLAASPPPDSGALNWPTAEQQGLLGELVGQRRRGGGGLRAWVERASPPFERPTAALLPSIHLAMAAAGISVPWLAERHEACVRQNRRAIDAGIETAAVLRGAGIPAVLIKGVPLLLFHYREPGARPMADADLVLRPEHLLHADELLRREGWRRKGMTPPPAALPFLRALDYAHPGGASVDVQRYPFSPRSPASAVRRFWDRCEEREVNGQRVLVPDATAMLLLTCLHGRKPESSTARWPLDAHAILCRGGEPIDWDALVSLAGAAAVVSPVRDALEYLACDLELPIPAEIRAHLARLEPSRTDRRQYELLARGPRRAGALDVLATRWDEYAAIRADQGILRAALGFPGYFLTVNAFYRGRALTFADVWARLATDSRRLARGALGRRA